PSKSQTCIAIYQSVARSPCSLTASRRYDMLMLLARAERTPWQPPTGGGEVRQGVRPPHDGGGHDHRKHSAAEGNRGHHDNSGRQHQEGGRLAPCKEYRRSRGDKRERGS